MQKHFGDYAGMGIKGIDSWREIGKERKKDAGKIGGHWSMLFLEIGS